MTGDRDQGSGIRTPPGVVAVLMNPEGAVLVTRSDFDAAGYGGFSLYDAQKLRCRRRIMDTFMREFCHPDFVEHLSGFLAEEAFRKMCRKDGWRLIYVPIGHEDEQVERE